jgi:gliding motility-associated lipoprotein GldH
LEQDPSTLSALLLGSDTLFRVDVEGVADTMKVRESDIYRLEIEDTISQNNVFINIRNNKDYAFSNLFLISQIQFPDGYRVVDTLEYEMTDRTGNFLGSGYTDIKENKLFYKEKVRFNQSGNYVIKVEQAMRKNGNIQGLDSLKGITDIGLSIESLIE